MCSGICPAGYFCPSGTAYRLSNLCGRSPKQFYIYLLPICLSFCLLEWIFFFTINVFLYVVIPLVRIFTVQREAFNHPSSRPDITRLEVLLNWLAQELQYAPWGNTANMGNLSFVQKVGTVTSRAAPILCVSISAIQVSCVDEVNSKFSSEKQYVLLVF
jgi:hypothetical protein